MVEYSIEVSEDAPILITTVHEDFRVTPDLPLSADTITALEGLDGQYYFILDITEVKISFEEIINAANWGARDETVADKDAVEVPLWRHPQIIQTIIVARSGVLKLAARGLSTAAFGNLNVKVMDTIEEAIHYCHEQM